jgi:CBS domain-containing protein
MASKLAESEVRTIPLTAREIMNPFVYTVQADATIDDAVQLMSSQHISGVPVVDQGRRLLGVVTEADLINPEKREAAVPRVLLYGVMPLPDDQLCAAVRRKTLRVKDLMTQPAVTATEDATIHELADLMVRHWINRVPIVRGGRLIGIVSRSDLVHALALGTWPGPERSREQV